VLCPESILPETVVQEGTKLAPTLEPLPFRVILFWIQVSTIGGAMATVGGVVLLPTEVVEDAVQPVPVFVT